MFYYIFKNKILISKYKMPNLKEVCENTAKNSQGNIYILHTLPPLKSRKYFLISDPSLIFLKKEGIHLLKKHSSSTPPIPNWLISKIAEKKVIGVNMEYPNWEKALDYSHPTKWKVHIIGLGDVGGTLLTGLRLLGGNYISQIGIYEKNNNQCKRWLYEANQILLPFNDQVYPDIYSIEQEKIFDCDMFIFCASAGVPPVGQEQRDVRMIQLKANTQIVDTYAKMARQKKFKGIFAIVSDPVDLLCKAVFLSSNKNEYNQLDFQGLAPEQIRGYGLGVMHARAAYYAKQYPKARHYLNEGRAFGPHGEGLIIADSIKNYNEDISSFLTEKARNANLEIRTTGFKPYIAPALSSGTLSILATIKGEWHYSATFMGGVFMGAKNRYTASGTELERLDLPPVLFNRLESTFERLENII